MESQKRGRPQTDIAELLRRRIWYWNVKKRSGMSDYMLSKTFDFGMNYSSKSRKGKVRRKIFERLRKFDEMPFRGRTEKFVRMVDGHQKCPDLRGTAQLYLSPFWELIGNSPMTLKRLRAFILECARNTGLLADAGYIDEEKELIDHTKHMTQRDQAIFLMKTVEHYRDALERAFVNCEPNLDTLALIGGLRREAIYAGNLWVAELLDGYFSDLLEVIMGSDWIPEDVREDLYVLAIERVLTISFPISPSEKKYLELLHEGENAGSPLASLLARHDRLLRG